MNASWKGWAGGREANRSELLFASGLVLNKRFKLGLYGWYVNVCVCACVFCLSALGACVVNNWLSNRIFFIRQAGDAQED